jgi:hypothetical protein
MTLENTVLLTDAHINAIAHRTNWFLAKCTNIFTNRLDNLWCDQYVLYDYKATNVATEVVSLQ